MAQGLILGANIDDGTLVLVALTITGVVLGAMGWMLRELFRLSRIVGQLEQRITDHREEDDRRFREHGRDIERLQAGFAWAQSRPPAPPVTWHGPGGS